MPRVLRCPFCLKRYDLKKPLHTHMEKEHENELQGLTPLHIMFNIRNNKPMFQVFSKSIVSNRAVTFNEKTGRYNYFADDADKKLYREKFLKNMNGKYGKNHLLNDIEMQKKMLHNKNYAGEYTFSDGGVVGFLGKYEENFLRHLDEVLGLPSQDVLPEPFVVKYNYDGKDRQHLPDFYIPTLKILINIKGDHKLRRQLIEKELKQDEAIKKTLKDIKYIKIVDNNFKMFDDLYYKTIEYGDEK